MPTKPLEADDVLDADPTERPGEPAIVEPEPARAVEPWPEWVTAASVVKDRLNADEVARASKRKALIALDVKRKTFRENGLARSLVTEVTEEYDALVRQAMLRERRKSLKDMTTTDKQIYKKQRGLEDPKALERARQQRECLNSFASFVQTFWPEIEPATKLVWNWHHELLCELLQRVFAGRYGKVTIDGEEHEGIQNLLINIPPGHMKSLICNVFWPAWCWFRNPGWRSIHATYDAKLMFRDAGKTRDIIQSDLYKALQPRVYGDQWNRAWTLKEDAKSKGMYFTEYHGMRLATTVGGAGTGHRADVIVIDDPMNVKQHPTPEELDKVISWYDGRMSSRFSKQAEGRIVCIMQRLHENDLAGHIIESDKREVGNKSWRPFEKVILPAEFDKKKAEQEGWIKYDLRTKDGEVLCPGIADQEALDNQKIKLAVAYSAQYDQDPAPAGGGILKASKLCFWYPRERMMNPPAIHHEKDEDGNLVPCVQGPLPERMHTFSQSWDCAFKESTDNDFVSGQLWAQSGPNAYLIAHTHGHFSFMRTLEQILAMTKAEPRCGAKYIEDKANGPALIDTLRHHVGGVVEVDPKGGKVVRAWAASPFIEAGNVWLPHPMLFPEITDTMLAEIRAFPRGKHDDTVDAMTQYINKAMIGSALSYLIGITKWGSA